MTLELASDSRVGTHYARHWERPCYGWRERYLPIEENMNKSKSSSRAAQLTNFLPVKIY